VAVELACRQPQVVQESAGIRNLRSMLASLWLHEEYLGKFQGIGRQNKLWMMLAEQDSFGCHLHVECGNSGLDEIPLVAF
jgi:hypothetical protein